MMTSPLRSLLPRQTLRTLDNEPGHYPTRERAADRNGKFPIFFDDRDVEVFGAAEVSAPTMLRLGSKNLDDDLQSGIVVFASASKGVVEPWLKTALQQQPIKPFVEGYLFEQDIDKMSADFLTGSDLATVGFGFSSPLTAKTTFRLEFPINSKTKLDPLSASVFYYNFSHGVFEEKAPQLKSAPDYTAGTLQDAKFFDYAGNYVLSGSTIDGFEQAAISNFDFNAHGDGLSVDPIPRIRELAPPLLTFDEKEAGLRNSSYEPTVSQSLSMEFLTQPFVLERLIIEFPFTAGPGWMTDKTQIPLYTSIFDFGNPLVPGGPCVTFALLNDIDQTHRELIASATIVPIKDVTDKGTLNFNGKGCNFLDFSSPTCVVTGTSDFFTGTVRFEIKPASSCGLSIIPSFTDDRYSVLSTTPTGRNCDGVTSGRSIFGKEKIFPTQTSIDPTQDYRLDAANVIARIEAHSSSPYLLHPTDKIVFSISKLHAAFISGLSTPVLSSSHDVAIDKGTMRVTFYGSYVRGGAEVLPTSNEPLTSLAVHESQGDPTQDEWNVEKSFTYVGSWTDDIITGSMTNVYGNSLNFEIARGVMGSRALVTSSIGTVDLWSVRYGVSSYEIAGTNLTSQATSQNERCWDTLLPSISDVVEADGSQIYKFNGLGPTNLGVLIFDVNVPSGSSEIQGDDLFSRSYPFAPEYLNLIRRLSQNNNIRSHKEIESGVVSTVESSLDLLYVITQIGSTASIMIVVDANPVISTQPIYLAPDDITVMKLFFGFGNRNTITFDDFTNQLVGSCTGIDYALKVGTALIAPKIRGWKYGIYNAVPAYSRNHSRRDHYGQLRDTLEQRIDTTFFETVGYKSDGSTGGVIGKLPSPVLVRFVNVSGSAVAPSLTTAQNLSYEATSSMPYFDGFARNR